MAPRWSCGENGHLMSINNASYVKQYLIVSQNQEGQEYLALGKKKKKKEREREKKKEKSLSFYTEEQERLFVGDEWKHSLFGCQ